MSTRRVLLLAAGTVLLASCVRPVSLPSSELACRTDEEGEPANGVVLMAQAVERASFVPCLDEVPSGWTLSDVQVRDGSGRFALDSNRDGGRAIQATFSPSCDPTSATEVASDRDRVRRLELVTQLSPSYAGTRFYVFDGGCLTLYFRASSQFRAERLAVATEAIVLVPRPDVEQYVRDETGGRLELDPPEEPR